MTTDLVETKLPSGIKKWIYSLFKIVFYLFFVRPLALIVLGLNVRNREKYPTCGPAVIAANHNSHLDTIVLLSLFPLKSIFSVRPVAAADYFLKNPLMAWFSLNIIGIIPVRRSGKKDSNEDPLAGVKQALLDKQIVVIFPEGSRGEPESPADFKKGISYIAESFPEVPVCPVFLYGLGKSLPRGDFVLVPFFCDVFVGSHIKWNGDREGFMAELKTEMNNLAKEVRLENWE